MGIELLPGERSRGEKMRLPFRRDNSENAVLMRDLDALAGAYRDGAPPPPAREDAAAHSDESTGMERILADDGFVRNFVRTVVHVRRYLPFYGVGAALLLVFALVAPVSDGSSGTQFASDVVAADPDVIEDETETADTPATDATVPAFSGGAVDFAPAEPFEPSPSFDDDFSPAPTFGSDSPTFAAPEPAHQPLRITASGYASVSGGTPFEVEPADGALPVSAGAGEAGRISFIKVAGDGEKLRLQEAPDSVNGAGASVTACLISEDWEPARGMAMSDAPEYDAEHCSTGIRTSDGIWTFDLLVFSDSTGFGLALVPGPAVAPPTFDIAFEPKALSAPATAS